MRAYSRARSYPNSSNSTPHIHSSRGFSPRRRFSTKSGADSRVRGSVSDGKPSGSAWRCVITELRISDCGFRIGNQISYSGVFMLLQSEILLAVFDAEGREAFVVFSMCFTRRLL